MRYIVIVFLLASVFISSAPASAQTIFEQGVYEFEETVLQMTYSGTWGTVTAFGNLARRATTGTTQVQFLAEGETLVIWRRMVQSTGNSMLVCVGLYGGGIPCTTISNDTTSATYWHPVRFTMPSPGTVQVSIERTGGTLDLDYFMVLADPDLFGMPTAVPTVPTATILPSSTPAFTATPGDTPVPTATILPSSTPAFTATPQPTATPYTVPDVFYAIDPAARYDTVNGQITITRYEMRASDYTSQFLLVVLVIVNLVAVGLAIWKRK